MTKEEFKRELRTAMYDVCDKIPDNADVEGDIKIHVKLRVPKGEKLLNEDELY